MIVPLRRRYPNRYEVPVIERADTAIFTRVFLPQCTICSGSCCAFGVCVDLENIRRLEAWAPLLEEYVGVSRELWFTADLISDPEFPAGGYRRTRVVGGGCVFLATGGRCLLHSFCLEQGIDHRLLKPMLSSFFPVTAEAGTLRPSAEVGDESLDCLAAGVSLYRGGRDDLLYYYGSDLIRELDHLESVARAE